MGRRYLSLLAVFALAIGLAAPAGSAGLRWREVDRGFGAATAPAHPSALLAVDRASRSRLAQRLPVTARPALGAVDVTREAVVGLFAGFGCKDHRVVVRTIVRKAGVLVVSLVERPLEPGRAECQAIFATWRLLTVTRSQLARPLPTRVEVRFARA